MSNRNQTSLGDFALIDEDVSLTNKENQFQSTNNNLTDKVHDSSMNNNSNNGILPLRINVTSRTATTHASSLNSKVNGHLTTLQDENSTFMNVMKACHFLNQFCSHGSYNAIPSQSQSQSSPPAPKIIQSSVIHIQQYTKDISQIIHALSNTSTSHTDRRCRIIAIQTLSTISLQTTLPKLYSITHNPHLYSNREDIQYITQIEDEICNDVIMNIVNHCILDDDDEGVVAVGMECLGKFVVGDSLGHDDLSKEICDLRGSMMSKVNHLVPRRGLWDGHYDKSSSFAAMNSGSSASTSSYVDHIQDVDYKIHRLDMQWRILESILGPRVRKLFIRVSLLQNIQHQIRSLTVLNEIMIFVYKTECRRRSTGGGSTLIGDDNDYGGLGKDGFAKRWYEFDSTMLVQEYVDVMLIPLLRHFEYMGGCSSSSNSTMQQNHAVEMSLCVVSNALRLSSAVLCRESWFDQLIHLSIQNLDFGFNAMKNGVHSSISLNAKLDLISLMLVALRGIKRLDRAQYLVVIVESICTIPSTHSIPKRCISPALTFENGFQRMPSRVGYWTEIALSLLLPDARNDVQRTHSTNTRSLSISSPIHYIEVFLQSNPVQTLLSSRSRMHKSNFILDPSEEFVYAVCSVAYTIGEKLFNQIDSVERTNDGDDNNNPMDIHDVNQLDLHSWLNITLELLNTFLPCLLWKSDNETDSKEFEHVTTMCHACQRAYLELLKNTLLASGLLCQSTSVFVNIVGPGTSNDSSKDNISEQTQSIQVLDLGIENKLRHMLDKLLNIISERESDLHCGNRISLLALLSDAWVEQSKRIVQSSELSRLDLNGNTGGPIDLDKVVNINERQVRELLSQLAMEISKLLDDEKKKNASYSNDQKEMESQRHLMTCISSVEIIGYISRLLVNFFSVTTSNPENADTCRHIISICTVVLKGQGRIEVEISDMEETEEVDRASDSTDSPPRSPRSKARITTFTSKCAGAANRLQDFMTRYNDDQHLQESNVSNQILYVLRNVCLDVVLNYQEDSLSLVLGGCDSKLFQYEEGMPHLQPKFTGGAFCSGYFILLYRQLLSQKVLHAINQSSYNLNSGPRYANTTNSSCAVMPTKIPDPLRLHSFLTEQSMDRAKDIVEIDKSYFLTSDKTRTLSSGSDPLAITLSYSARQWCSRYDGDIAWIFVVTVAVHNVTAVPILNGIRLDATITQDVSNKNRALIDGCKAAVLTENSLYNENLEAGGHFFWEIVLDSWPSGGKINISYTLCELGAESQTHKSFPFSSVNEEEVEGSEKQEDDLGGDHDQTEINVGTPGEEDDVLDVIFHGDEVIIPFTCLQPCPLTFYQNNEGDYATFQFLWLSMPYKQEVIIKDSTVRNIDADGKYLALYAMLKVPDDIKLKNWAFSTWSGNHILVIASRKGLETVFHVRGNDSQELHYYVDRFDFLSF